MLDITRDRPVKVAVKVAVPVRDHPKVEQHQQKRLLENQFMLFLECLFFYL